MKVFLIFLAGIFSSSAEFLQVELNCKLEKPKSDFYYNIEHSQGASINLFTCSLPHFVNLNDNLEITSKSIRNARIWINDAELFVSMDEKGMPLKMPMGVGSQFFGMKSLRIMMSPLREIDRGNFDKMEELKNLQLVRKSEVLVILNAFFHFLGQQSNRNHPH